MEICQGKLEGCRNFHPQGPIKMKRNTQTMFSPPWIIYIRDILISLIFSLYFLFLLTVTEFSSFNQNMEHLSSVKHKQGQFLNPTQMVSNLLIYLAKENPQESVTEANRKAAAMLGIGESTVKQIRMDSLAGKQLTPKSRRKRKVSETKTKNAREVTYDEGTRSQIRIVVHREFFLQNLPPTLKTVLAVVNADENLPQFARTTFHRLLLDMGFIFEKRGYKSIMVEREDIVRWRHQYLRQIRKYRHAGYNIVYLDESWVNVGHTVDKVWKDTTIRTPKEAFLQGLSPGLRAPTQRGPRFVLLHAGSEQGFVEGAECVFLAKKDSGDYHEEMNGELFERWFEETLIPRLPKDRKNLIVMDNAPYHSCKTDFPKTSWRKADIAAWLTRKDIFFEEDYLKSELLEVAKTYQEEFEHYKIELIAEKNGVEILRLPPYHCELNPIEMVWSQTKRYVALHNTDFKSQRVRQLIDEAFSKVSAENWRNYVRHVTTIEDDMWKVNNMQDDIEPIIINANMGSSSEGEMSGLESD